MIEQLEQLFCGVTWDGKLINKTHRDELIKKGLAGKIEGWNFITRKGIRYLNDLGMVTN